MRRHRWRKFECYQVTSYAIVIVDRIISFTSQCSSLVLILIRLFSGAQRHHLLSRATAASGATQFLLVQISCQIKS